MALLCLAVPGTGQAETCRNTSFQGTAYITCSFDPAKQDLRLFWRGADGKPYQTFAALARDLKSKGKSLQFAMNGGMYQDDFQPVGLYVENGRELTRANTATLTGAPSAIPNFFKKPNGVFYIGNGRAGILETGRFLAEKPEANFATQSGPDAHHRRSDPPGLHHEFNGSQNAERCRRDEPDRSALRHHKGRELSFTVARYFRDGLGCQECPSLSTEVWRPGSMRGTQPQRPSHGTMGLSVLQ